MNFFVVTNDFEPTSGPFASMLEAGTSALYHVALARDQQTALVVGMDSDEFRRDRPAYICLRVSAGENLDAAELGHDETTNFGNEAVS